VAVAGWEESSGHDGLPIEELKILKNLTTVTNYIHKLVEVNVAMQK